MWIKMKRERRFRPPDEWRVSVHYLDGHEYRVKRAWGDALVAAGDAEEIDAPSRDGADADE